MHIDEIYTEEKFNQDLKNSNAYFSFNREQAEQELKNWAEGSCLFRPSSTSGYIVLSIVLTKQQLKKLSGYSLSELNNPVNININKSSFIDEVANQALERNKYNEKDLDVGHFPYRVDKKENGEIEIVDDSQKPPQIIGTYNDLVNHVSRRGYHLLNDWQITRNYIKVNQPFITNPLFEQGVKQRNEERSAQLNATLGATKLSQLSESLSLWAIASTLTSASRSIASTLITASPKKEKAELIHEALTKLGTYGWVFKKPNSNTQIYNEISSSWSNEEIQETWAQTPPLDVKVAGYLSDEINDRYHCEIASWIAYTNPTTLEREAVVVIKNLLRLLELEENFVYSHLPSIKN